MTCYAIRRGRAIRGQHLDDCLGRLPITERPTPVVSCRGCLPCPDNHCVLCSVTHSDDAHPRVCPECLAGVREDLGAIVDLEELLWAQALLGGSDGRLEAARPIPGGEAMVMLAPSSPVGGADMLDDEAPPLLVLATWEDEWRLELGDGEGSWATTLGCVNYLDRNLTWAAQRHLEFDKFANDVGKLRNRLEDVLHAGERDERGAPCVHCSALLVRRADAKRGLLDAYDCPRCQRTYTLDQYRYAVGVAYRANATTLNAEDLATRLGVKANTIRQWAARGHVAKRGVDDLGRTLFDVADVERRHAERTVRTEEAV